MKWMLTLGLLSPAWAMCQITITAEDLPQPGQTYPLVNIAPPILSDLEASGPNTIWDYSTVIPLGDAPLTPLPMSEAPGLALFVFNNPFNSAYQCDFFLPTELPDVGIDLSGFIPVDGFSNFYKTDGAAYTIAGLALGAGGFDVPVPYDDVDELFPLPLEADASFTSTSSLALEIPETFGYWSDGTRDVLVDGWGTLILPDGPHEVLRVRSEINAQDSVFIPQLGTPFAFPRTQVVYQWYGNGFGFPLLEVSTLFGIPSTARYLNLAIEPSGISSANTNLYAVHPNPAARGQHVRFEGPAGSDYRWLDLGGRVIQEGNTANANDLISVPNRPGTYLLQVGTWSKLVCVQ